MRYRHRFSVEHAELGIRMVFWAGHVQARGDMAAPQARTAKSPYYPPQPISQLSKTHALYPYARNQKVGATLQRVDVHAIVHLLHPVHVLCTSETSRGRNGIRGGFRGFEC